MKILCLADLHRVTTDILALKEQDRWIRSLIEESNPNVVVITGDIFENNSGFHPYEDLYNLFQGIPVICTLGNHEFIYDTIENVLKKYKDDYEPKWNVHYLDIIGHYDIENIRFFGNVLWYDGTTASVANQNLADFAGGKWLDKVIRNFNPKNECNKCVEQIMNNQPNDNQIGILCTHTVPAKDINGHFQDGIAQPFDAFSGVSWLLDKVKCDYAISGHTHRRVIGKEINGVKCINTGNDYFPPFKHFLLKI